MFFSASFSLLITTTPQSNLTAPSQCDCTQSNLTAPPTQILSVGFDGGLHSRGVTALELTHLLPCCIKSMCGWGVWIDVLRVEYDVMRAGSVMWCGIVLCYVLLTVDSWQQGDGCWHGTLCYVVLKVVTDTDTDTANLLWRIGRWAGRAVGSVCGVRCCVVLCCVVLSCVVWCCVDSSHWHWHWY